MKTGPNKILTDLQQRTFDDALRIVRLVEALPKCEAEAIPGRQLLRSGTSFGANDRSAKRPRPQAEFISKLGIVEKEADEALVWIELLAASGKIPASKVESLVQEPNEILAINVSSIKTARSKSNPTKED